MEQEPKAAWRTWIGALALVLLVALVFGRALSNQFIGFDTGTYITDNRRVMAGVTWPGIEWAFTTFHGANWHPLTWISHMLDVSLFGLRPAGHHAMNVAFHAANSALVFLVLQRWTGRRAASFAVASLFAVHPLHVESVAWIVERKDVLSAFFGLAALLAWTGWARSRSRAAYVTSLLLFAAALLSKPMLVTLPFALLVFDAWPFRRTDRGWKALVLEKLPFFALVLVSCVLTWRAQSAGAAVQSLAGLPLGERIGNAIASYGWYATKSVWPAGLAFHYPLAASDVRAAHIGWGVIILAAVSGLAWVQRQRRPWILAGWLVFLGMLVPVIGIVQVGGQAHADRYAYLPILGLLIVAVWTLSELVASTSAKVVLASAFVATFGVLALQQVGVWKNDETLARHALDVDPRNAVAHDILGWTLFSRGDLQGGSEHLMRAIELQPNDPDARRNMGKALHRLGRLEEAEHELRQAAALRPDLPTLLELGAVLAEQGQVQEALSVLAFAASAAPDEVDARTAYGELLLRAGSLAQAESELRAALALAPRDLVVNVDLARALIEMGKPAEAEPLLRRALEVEAENPQALQQLARVLAARGEDEPAVSALRKAIAARPDWPAAMADLAWILATASEEKLRAPTEALALAARAVNLGNRDQPEFIDVLAAALAANGNYEGAAQAALDAAQRARLSGDADRAARIERRLAAYREKRMEPGPR